MAYQFDGVDDQVDFDRAPFTGYVAGPITIAALFKRGATGTVQSVAGIVDNTGSRRAYAGIHSINTPRLFIGAATNSTGTQTLSSTTVWYLYAATWAAAGTTPRFHIHDGTSWVHANGGTSIAANAAAVVATDLIRIGSAGGSFFNGDIVCAGIKKADSSDATTETLSRTLFQAWKDFGFDWLAGFQTSGTVLDQGTVGTGDELTRTGTTLVADPVGWTWPTPAIATIVTGGGISIYGVLEAAVALTYAGVELNYPTYADLEAGVPTYADLLGG
jgi:hypothetical protein